MITKLLEITKDDGGKCLQEILKRNFEVSTEAVEKVKSSNGQIPRALTKPCK